MTPATSPATARLHFGAFAALFCVGLWGTSFGPALPFLARDLDVGLGTAGSLLTALFAGSISASALITLRLHGADMRLLGIAGLAFAALGVAALAVAPNLPAGIAAALVLGVGDGLVVASVHALIGQTSEDIPREMSRLNLWFAFGAIIGPLWAGLALELTDGPMLVYAGLAAFIGGLAVYLLRTPPPGHLHEPPPASPIRLNRPLVVMSVLLFLYVGAEIGLGSWVASYTREAAEAGVLAGAVITSGYWGALALGRLLTGGLLARSHDAATVLVIAVAVAGVASLALALFGEVIAVAAIAAFITGLAFGPIWPLAMALGTREAPANAVAGMVTVGNTGGLVFPWAQGAVLASAGATEGVAVTAALCALMLVLAAGNWPRKHTE